MTQDITAALAQVGEVLQFYGNENNYDFSCTISRNQRLLGTPLVTSDNGLKARDALGTLSSIIEGLKERDRLPTAEDILNQDGATFDGADWHGASKAARKAVEALELLRPYLRQPANPVDVEGLIAKLVGEAYEAERKFQEGELFGLNKAIAIIRQHFGQQIKEEDHD